MMGGGDGTKDAADTSPRQDGTRVSGSRRRMRRVVVVTGTAAAVALVAGFVSFTARVPNDEVELDRNADGIVVLTGGSSRITDAIELLAAKRGQRLLITGVNPATNSGGIARLVPLYEQMFACCIDLDHSAVNTVGNAIETRRWAKARGFRSLIVVTSNYHMPRAMAELAHQLPDATLIAFPVVPERRRGEAWWSNYASVRLLLVEYLKYIFAVMRHGLDRSPTEIASRPGRLSGGVTS